MCVDKNVRAFFLIWSDSFQVQSVAHAQPVWKWGLNSLRVGLLFLVFIAQLSAAVCALKFGAFGDYMERASYLTYAHIRNILYVFIAG